MIEYLGAVSILAYWLAGACLLTRWRGTKAMSISEHAASAKQAYLFFAFTLTICGWLLYVFIIKWFMPHLGLSFVFGLIFTLAFAAQLIAAWIPAIPGWKSKIHTSVAYFMAFLFIPLAIEIIAASISNVARVIDVICLVYMVAAWYLLVMLREARQKYLLYQSLYVVAMQIIILSSAYIPKAF